MAIDLLMKALADPIRREILQLLKQKPLAATEIANAFSISFPAISRHLSILKEANLVRDERKGKFIYYTLNTSVFEEIFVWLYSLKEKEEKQHEKEMDSSY